jgi:hypothetical protein
MLRESKRKVSAIEGATLNKAGTEGRSVSGKAQFSSKLKNEMIKVLRLSRRGRL